MIYRLNNNGSTEEKIFVGETKVLIFNYNLTVPIKLVVLLTILFIFILSNLELKIDIIQSQTLFVLSLQTGNTEEQEKLGSSRWRKSRRTT